MLNGLKRFTGTIVFMAAFVLLVRGDLFAQTAGTLNYGDTVSGSTASSGTENWTFSGSAGDVVDISMESTEFDTYLELRGPDGVLIISDDDGGADTNSVIIRGLRETGQYTITAGGFGDERGSYTLTLEQNTELPSSVTNALAQANIGAGDGFIAEGLGETIIDLTDEDDTVEWVLMDGQYADFVLGADITWGPGAAEDTCGFIFRRVDEDNYYVVEIDRTGTVWFVERENGEWGDSEGDSYLAVRTGAKDDNQLVLSVSGSTFIVYVNGQRTATFSDTSNASGETAVEMTTYDESTVTNCTFNNVWVWDLGQSTSGLPTATPGSLPTLPGGNTQPTKTPVPSSNVPTGAMVTINVPSANLRSGPGTDFERVESASQGDTFSVIAQAGSGADTWYLVSIPGNREGWLWSGIVTLSPANAIIPLAEDVGVVSSGGQSPVISTIVSQGPCDDITFVVNWSDADGDAAQIEWLDTDTGEIVFTDDISGSGGSFSSPDWFCESDTCTTNARVRDAAGNVSSIYEVTTVCS